MSAKKPKKQGPTEEERALAKRGAMEHNDFVERGLPLARKFAEIMADPSHGKRLAGQATAQVAEAFANDASAGYEQSLASGGAPGSGASLTALTLPGVKQASASGVATGRAMQAAKDRELTGFRKLAAFGRGVADTSSVGLRGAARNATEEAISEANAKTANYVATLDAIGKTAGYVGGQALHDIKYGRDLAAFAKANPQLKVPEPTGLMSGWAYRRALR